jgi:hypothetical protein
VTLLLFVEDPGDKGRGMGVEKRYSEELEQSIDLCTHHPCGHFWSLIVFTASEHHHPGVNGRDECKGSYDWGAVCGRKGRRKDIRDEEYGNMGRVGRGRGVGEGAGGGASCSPGRRSIRRQKGFNAFFLLSGTSAAWGSARILIMYLTIF